MIGDVPDELGERVIATLRDAGARFGFLHGSRALGTHRVDSDVDVAAWWGESAPASFEVALPPSVDLLVLDTAPLELRGRVAHRGLLLFDDDPPARVEWVATTRKIWFDERPRFERAHREFLESVLRGR
ncbi:nucleotidyltransferase domain-containing protein [Actinomycetospora termitidis]|uniref:Nucleotidyltransferase domain-containing protein n=1 Tax=Actinomycetospora termitidis TaxID=3053470 RepID=A0ABT7MGQ8_9PSEU|nr:nucleotidyltransferase domain-containing protein [Actinomycetospora sp. Odt1-22]MDL5159032.1 nucleotidyltransferase domain-containing protein [Actinomycetospora sp. Odt1-22]